MAEKLPVAVPHAGLDGSDLHQAIGGTATWRRLAVAFYSRVDRDPLLRPLFPGMTLHCAIEEFTAFLAQLFEGPSEDTQRRWWLSLRESHLRFRIRRNERAAWMENMVKALDDARIEEPLRSALREFFERSSAHVVNSGEPAPTGADPGEPGGDTIRREIARRWEVQCGLDEAVAAVRSGEADRAIATAESLRNRSVLAGLLALMMGSRNPAMLRYVQERVTHDPALVRERYAGRTLLHEASAQGNLTMVESLLRLGADPNAQDGGDHTPLYCLANQYRASGGGDVVRALAQSGANVNANDGVKRCTALHMAARRGNREIAEALLDCGADIDARDSLGETPLRRSVNCNKIEVASLLLARGADLHSTGSKGLTPLLAARTSAMKELLLASSSAAGSLTSAGTGTFKKQKNRIGKS
jgi:truncated hemoglobin YjbI